MAEPGDKQSLFSFSLTGYLDLYHKGLFRGQFRRYWFWFDEKHCSLKYYKSRESYRHYVHNPLGSIVMEFAKVSPPMAVEMGGNVFQIEANGQTYLLAASDTNNAHNWIKQLQVKRSEYLRSEAAKVENSLDLENKKKALRPLHERPGGVLSTSQTEGTKEGSVVRRIMDSHISKARQGSRHSANPDLLTSESLDRLASFVSDPSVSQSSKAPLQKSLSDSGEVHSSLSHPRKALTPEPEELAPGRERCPQSLPSIPMSSIDREKLQLAHDYHRSQEEVTRLQKEVIRFSDKLEKREQEIVQLNLQVSALKEEIAKMRMPQDQLRLENESLKDIIDQCKRSIRSLDDEIELHKLHQKEHDKRIRTEKQRAADLERELNIFKAKYVKLLSDKFKITIPNPAGPQEDGADPDEEKYNKELLGLIKQEGGDNPVFESYQSQFEDQYGDLHDWSSGSTVQHYLCRQLFIHYTQQEHVSLVEEWDEYLSQMKKVRSKSYIELPLGNERSKRDFRNLLRGGIPIHHRSQVWTALVYRHVGRMKDIKDATAGKGCSYYQSLLNSRTATQAEKQIRLDLFRTLPNNRHFKLGGAGSSKLENVLIAFSRHHKNVGYCQGMNMLAAIGILFVDEETVFWMLVAIIEKLLPAQYFTPGLLGAQADQAVVHELVADKLPRLNRHLENYSIDVTLVTFNWFLTLYIDALPTESVLRILDCFLLEGTKVLFRMCLGILRLNERLLLSLTDPVSLFQFLKEIAKHTFDVESLFHTAFNELQPFQSRSALVSRHHHHFAKLKEQWVQREKERAVHDNNAKLERIKTQVSLRASAIITVREQQRRHLMWECGCLRTSEEVWLACGERQHGKIGIITADESFSIEIPKDEVASRVMCIHHVKSCDIMLLGTLDFVLHAIDCTTRKEVWSVKMNDSVLGIEATEDGTVFAVLADGFVAVYQDISLLPPDSEPDLFRIGSGPVSCLALAPGQQVWFGCDKSITMMSATTFELVQSLVMPDNTGKVYKMVTSSLGIWVTFRSSSVVCLFEVEHYIKLVQVDYMTLTPLLQGQMADFRITSIMTSGDHVWVGTGSGNVHIFSVESNVLNPAATILQLAQRQSRELAVAHGGVRRAVNTGGLLTGEAGTEEGEGEREDEERQATAAERRYKTRNQYYDKRRKTQFGRTLRREKRSENSTEKDKKEPAVYKLVHQASNQLVQTKNEAVRVILPLRSDNEHQAVSCVHCVNEPEKSIQVWKCPPDESPISWSFGYLPACELVAESLNSRSPKGKSPEPTPPVQGKEEGVTHQPGSMREESTEESSSTSSR